MPHEWRGHQNVKVSVLNYLKTVVARKFLLELKFKMHRDIRSIRLYIPIHIYFVNVHELHIMMLHLNT